MLTSVFLRCAQAKQQAEAQMGLQLQLREREDALAAAELAAQKAVQVRRARAQS
jgi:hypothetical protein